MEAIVDTRADEEYKLYKDALKSFIVERKEDRHIHKAKF